MLQQVVHHRNKYQPEMMMHQIVLQMLRHPTHYYKYLEHELIETGESYESYCCNVYRGNVWGNDLLASVVGDMWNIAITIISPSCSKPFHLFHDKPEPDVVIVANGGSWLSEKKSTTHFNAT